MRQIFLVTLAVVLVVTLIFTSCAEEVTPTTPTTPTQPTTPTTPTTPAALEWPEFLTFITLPTVTTGYTATAAWTSILEAGTGMKVRITPVESPVGVWKIFKTGQYDISCMVSSMVCNGFESEYAIADKECGPYHLSLLWRLSNLPEGLWVRGDSPIKSWADVKPGVRAAYEAGSAHSPIAAKAVIAWAGLDPEKDAVYVPAASADACVDLVLEGKADLSNLVGITSPFTYRAAANPYGIRVLEMDPAKDPEAAKRFLDYLPSTIFIKCTVGPEEGHGLVVSAGLYLYAIAPEFDEELAYQLAKWLDENFDSYKDQDFRVADMGIDPFLEILPTFYIPTHDGVIKYFKEKGVWTDQMQSSSDKSAELIDKYINAFDAAVASAEAKGVVVDPLNEVWLDYWANYKKELGLRRFSAWL